MRIKPERQPAEIRINNFREVTQVLSDDLALQEATRCLQCKRAPCIEGCPVNIDIPAFIKLIKNGQRAQALAKIKEYNSLPGICGRVCPQEEQCEKNCLLGKKGNPINIGALERFAADVIGQENNTPQGIRQQNTQGLKVAVVGSGPAGLTCAAQLAQDGYAVTLFESLHEPGGVLSYGIPEFRLPKKIVAQEVSYVHSLGVRILTDNLIGNTFGLEELLNKHGFAAIFIASGAGLPEFLSIPGENLAGVYSANEFLCRINLMKAYDFPSHATPLNIGENTMIVGGGNVALDCARCAKRLGSRAILAYRRTESEMPARQEEIENAKEEGIEFFFLTQPLEFIGDEQNRLRAAKCLKMELGQADGSGRRRPLPLPGSEFLIQADTAVIAIGQSPNPLLPRTCQDLRINADGTIVVDKNLMTSLPGVFAGGDIVSGAATVISAMSAGKKGAAAINAYLQERFKK